jgi:hypothetical protein
VNTEANPQSKGHDKSARSTRNGWLPVVAQIWMIGVLLIFMIIRVVGSNTAQNILHKLGLR